jgi:hypothetical protein
MLSHEFFSKLCLVIPIALLIVFGFVLIIPDIILFNPRIL